jgi:hypothetical protein
MPIPDATYSTLGNIQTKVRRLTRSPSTAQLSDADLNNYINTFLLYDMPEELRLFNFRTTFQFYTKPNVDTYQNNDVTTTDPFYNFKNKYISIHPPCYVAGYQVLLTQSREQLYGMYPQISSIQPTNLVGDGVTLTFTGTLPAVPVLAGTITFDSIGPNNAGLTLKDVPVPGYDNIVNLVTPNLAPAPGITPNNTVNLITGVYTITFPVAPAFGKQINSQSYSYVASLPQAVLYYDDQFILRPVPDQSYPVNVEAYIRPTELLLAADIPELAGNWQYIAYGAAIKVFQDRQDLDSVQLVMPEYKRQESLVIRRTLVQITNERAATIYTQQSSGVNNIGWGWGTNGPF